MGYVARPTPEMGEYSVEVRNESFYLRGDCQHTTKRPDGRESHWPDRHAILVYEHSDFGCGTVEILIEDIPKIRAAIDQVERIHNDHPLPDD